MVNIRFFCLLFSAFLAAIIFVFISTANFTPARKDLLLTQSYALTAVTFLYLTLMASPYAKILTFMPFKGAYIKARRALGVSAFLFAALHAYFAFFKVIGGIENLMLLSQTYKLGVFFGSISLMILFLLTLTATDFAIDKLTFKKWKMLHRLVYVVAILVVFHAIRLGSHFANLSGAIPRIFFIAGAILLTLEVIRFVRYLSEKVK